MSTISCGSDQTLFIENWASSTLDSTATGLVALFSDAVQRPAGRDRLQRVVGGAVLVDPAAQPAGGGVGIELAGLPEGARVEVREVGRHVVDRRDDGDLAGVVQLLEAGRGRVPGPVRVGGRSAQRQAVGRCQPDVRALGRVGSVVGAGDRDQGVQAVVAAVQEDRDDDRVGTRASPPAPMPPPRCGPSRASRRRTPSGTRPRRCAGSHGGTCPRSRPRRTARGIGTTLALAAQHRSTVGGLPVVASAVVHQVVAPIMVSGGGRQDRPSASPGSPSGAPIVVVRVQRRPVAGGVVGGVGLELGPRVARGPGVRRAPRWRR